MSNQLRVTWNGRTEVFDDTRGAIRIGRNPECEIVLDAPSVSRQHAELRFGDGHWRIEDQQSSHGVFVNGDRATSFEIRQAVEIYFGRPETAPSISVEPIADTTAETTDLPSATPLTGDATVHRDPATTAGAPSSATVIPGDPQRPGGVLRDGDVAGATVVTGETITVAIGDNSQQFQPGDVIVIGRESDCNVQSANPTVSRHHARITHTPGGWQIEDQNSSGGTYIDGKRITTAKLVGSTAVILGENGDAGERVVVVASGTRKRSFVQQMTKSGVIPLVAAGFAVVALLVAVIAFLANRDSAPNNEELAQATVAVSADSRSGSGSIIDADEGLILTNAHVVAPTADGQALTDVPFVSGTAVEPDEIAILIAGGLDKTAEPEFLAEVVAVDGYADLAVLRITRRISGSLIEDGDLDGLREVELGDSDDVVTGDDVRVFGFPGASNSNAATLSSGVISGSVQDDRMNSNRAFLNFDADIYAGNSGGMAADEDGKLIGVPTLTWLDEPGGELGVSSMRPINYAKPLIDAAREGEEYESPYVSDFDGEITDVTPTTAGRREGVTECGSSTPRPSNSATAIGFAVEFEGHADGEHVDIAVGLFDGSELVSVYSTAWEYPVEFPEEGCRLVTLVLDNPLGAYDDPTFAVAVGPNYEEIDL